MEKVNSRVQLANDLLAVACGEVDFYAESETRAEKADVVCDQVRDMLFEVSEFLLSDAMTKKEIIKDWGGDAGEAAQAFWGKTSTNVVHWNEVVQDEVSDFWGDKVEQKAEKFGEKTKDLWDNRPRKRHQNMLEANVFMAADAAIYGF